MAMPESRRSTAAPEPRLASNRHDGSLSGRFARLRRDPRHYQIAVLSCLVAYGLVALDLEIRPSIAASALGAALLTQAFWTWRRRLPTLDLRSPLISGLSLCLLLRTTSVELAALTGFLAISSKFWIRARGKHVFNPTNFALASMMLVTDHVWVSPGQWGSPALFAFFLAGLGGLVVYRAARSDVTYAFFVSYVAILLGRALWLGDPFSIPLHQAQNGAFLIFTFHMISDPKTTPDSRAGRILFAALVALGAAYVQFVRFQPNGMIWSLVCFAVTVPIIDRLLGGRRYRWSSARPGASRKETSMSSATTHPNPQRVPIWSRAAFRSRAWLRGTALAIAFSLVAQSAWAFCGFYVAKADSRLFNEASQVVLVRKDDRTVITMASDYRGDPTEFAVVIPVPTFIERSQIHVTDQGLIDHLDTFTSPRLVEYYDPDPCMRLRKEAWALQERAAPESAARDEDGESRQVTIEATYTVGEYDIVILSATESHALESWLLDNGYRIPDGASDVLGSYLKQDMRFFVAKVNLEEQARLGYANLRPLQVAYESHKFMLPIRLGTVNAEGPQDLILYALTATGRVETTNYRTVKLPTGMDLPLFVEHEFDDFYRDMFSHQVEKEGMRAVFLEYAWDMAWCDPCAADPLRQDQLRELGVFWLDDASRTAQAQNVFVTRLHVRYDREHFPEDLMLQETGDRTNFQGRYVLRHPWRGESDCPDVAEYRRALVERQQQTAQNLARLTGWDLDVITASMEGEILDPVPEPKPWWEKIWRN